MRLDPLVSPQELKDSVAAVAFPVFPPEVLIHLLVGRGEVIEHGAIAYETRELHLTRDSKRPDAEPPFLEDIMGFHAPVHVAAAHHSHPERGWGHGGGCWGLQGLRGRWLLGSALQTSTVVEDGQQASIWAPSRSRQRLPGLPGGFCFRGWSVIGS